MDNYLVEIDGGKVTGEVVELEDGEVSGYTAKSKSFDMGTPEDESDDYTFTYYVAAE